MKKRILVVEDEEKLRRVLELQLVSAGFDVDKAATAEEGLKLVDRANLVLSGKGQHFSRCFADGAGCLRMCKNSIHRGEFFS